jgi:ferredoxin
VSLLINDQCFNCDVCVDKCPNKAIFEGKAIYEINPDLCTECVGHFDEPQCVVFCPLGDECIEPDPQHPLQSMADEVEGR